MRHSGRRLPDGIQTLQLLDGSLCFLTLFNLRAQLLIDLRQFAGAVLNALLQNSFYLFSRRNVERYPFKGDWLLIFEICPSSCGNPAFHPVSSNHPVLDIVQPIRPRIHAMLDSGQYAFEIVRVSGSVTVSQRMSSLPCQTSALMPPELEKNHIAGKGRQRRSPAAARQKRNSHGA